MKNKLPRLFGWALIALALLVLLVMVRPAEISTLLSKFAVLACAGVAGYWLDRALFPYARPDSFFCNEEVPGMTDNRVIKTLGTVTLSTGAALQTLLILFCASMIRRAMVVAACMLCAAVGL